TMFGCLRCVSRIASPISRFQSNALNVVCDSNAVADVGVAELVCAHMDAVPCPVTFKSLGERLRALPNTSGLFIRFPASTGNHTRIISLSFRFSATLQQRVLPAHWNFSSVFGSRALILACVSGV